jgi:hypothetical protein
MPKKKPRPTTSQVAGAQLAAEIERMAGYRYRGADLLRFLLDELFSRFGLEPWQNTPDDAREMARTLAGLYVENVGALPPFTDILGPAYMVVASHGQRDGLGQFFTAAPVAKMMALMTLGDSPAPGTVVRACDPACGSGVMMLSLASAMLETHGPDALGQLSVSCVDLDGYCARMAACQFLVNLHVHGLSLSELLVLRGDSLFLKPETTEVLVHATRKELPGDQWAPALHLARLQAISKAAVQAGVGDQFDLFSDGDQEQVA